MTARWNGLPPDPSVSGWHWVEKEYGKDLLYWKKERKIWLGINRFDVFIPRGIHFDKLQYYGPATPPTEPAQLLPGQILEE